jgi:hypothetical protein
VTVCAAAGGVGGGVEAVFVGVKAVASTGAGGVTSVTFGAKVSRSIEGFSS